MKKEIYLDRNNICIKANYDKAPSNVYDASARPSSIITSKAKSILSENAWKLYDYAANFPNHAVAVAPVVQWADMLKITFDEFYLAVKELYEHRYLSFRANADGDEIFVGNSYIFIPDNSLVGRLTGTESDLEEVYKPFCYPEGNSAVNKKEW